MYSLKFYLLEETGCHLVSAADPIIFFLLCFRLAFPHHTKMTFCYQNQCEDVCYSPCNYGTVSSCYQNQCEDVCYSPCSYRSYDCGSPCSYRSYGSLSSYRDCYPSYSYSCCYPSYSYRYPSYSYCYPYSSRYTRRYSCYPRYPC